MLFNRRSLVLGVILVATSAGAEETPINGVRLSFVRTESAAGCISAPALEREITRRMGRDPFAGPARQWIEGFIERQASTFEAQIFERDADGLLLGNRRLREPAGDCHKLDAAIVLAIALIIDPNARLAPATSSASTPLASASSERQRLNESNPTSVAAHRLVAQPASSASHGTSAPTQYQMLHSQTKRRGDPGGLGKRLLQMPSSHTRGLPQRCSVAFRANTARTSARITGHQRPAVTASTIQPQAQPPAAHRLPRPRPRW